jgi:hypothetical protein
LKNAFAVLILLCSATLTQAAGIPSPQEVFGFKMGEDKKLIDWSQIVSYFKTVDDQSGRVIVQELGRSTRDRPFILAIISSEANIKNIERYKAIQRQLAKPYTLDADAAAKLVGEGKTVVLITLNIHSTEIAASQESVELLHEFATSDSPQVQKILDNCIVLLIPSLNPDGQQLVVDWYKKTLGTPSEGVLPPELYHYYAGHDNNRDWFMYNLAESRHTARVLYHDWFPEIVYDQHQMGYNGPRLFLPPYSDPVNPNVHPLLTAQTNLLGKYVVTALQQQGFKGVVTGTVFNAFFEGTMSKTPLWHNRIGILSEMAGVNIATPVYFPKGSVGGMGLELPENKTQTNFLDPWNGGWWRLRDIIDYEKAVTYSLLEFAAIFKDQVKTNFYNLNRESIKRGQTQAPYGFLVPVDQHDPNAATELVNRLIISGVEVNETTEPLSVEGRKVSVGSYWIPLAQPSRAYIKDLLEAQIYPNLKQYPGGPPRVPYDVTGWTLPMQMGVEVLELNEPLALQIKPVQTATIPGGLGTPAGQFFILERRYSNSYGLAHALLKQNVAVYELLQPIESPIQARSSLPAGTFVIPADRVDRALLDRLAREWQVPVGSIESRPAQMRELGRARIGIYQPWVTSIDEGWTRFVLDQFKIEYRTLHNDDIKKGGAKLRAEYDLIIVPDLSVNLIINGKEEPPEGAKADKEEEPIVGTPQLPKEYQGGIGKEGVEAVKDFVKNGGTLLTFATACNFAIEKLRLPAINELKGVSSKDFYAPGSIFEVNIDSREPLAFGMQQKAFIYFVNNPAFKLLPYTKESKNIAFYGDSSPIRSGSLLGEERLLGKTALADIPIEKGRVVMYGFRVQHRGQTYGTYKLMLNALFK